VRTYALYLDQRLEFFLHERKQGFLDRFLA
jgi:hypothetical protein